MEADPVAGGVKGGKPGHAIDHFLIFLLSSIGVVDAAFIADSVCSGRRLARPGRAWKFILATI